MRDNSQGSSDKYFRQQLPHSVSLTSLVISHTMFRDTFHGGQQKTPETFLLQNINLEKHKPISTVQNKWTCY
jgi:hypothetical protein